MRKIILFFLAFNTLTSIAVFAVPEIDTSIIIYKPDGLADEWPVNLFSIDKKNGVELAAANDGQNLYVIIRTANPAVQTKMLQNGMQFFIDTKGKHKKTTGVEFPLKSAGQNNNTNPEELMIMAAMNPSIKVFGFAEGEPVIQRPDIEDNIRLGFAADTADFLNIEYLIPLNMLEKEIASLNQKTINFGWLINGTEEMPQRFQGNSNPMGGVPNNGLSHTSKRPGQEIPDYNPDIENRMRKQEFWIQYTITQ